MFCEEELNMRQIYINDVSLWLPLPPLSRLSIAPSLQQQANKLWIEKVKVKKDVAYFPLNGGRYPEFPQRFVNGRLAASPHTDNDTSYLKLYLRSQALSYLSLLYART